MSNQISEVFGTPARGVSRQVITPEPAQKAPGELADAANVDAMAIPYGQTVMTKQGRVCSAQPSPEYRPYGGGHGKAP